jgi:uncharacterized membrane protein
LCGGSFQLEEHTRQFLRTHSSQTHPAALSALLLTLLLALLAFLLALLLLLLPTLLALLLAFLALLLAFLFAFLPAHAILLAVAFCRPCTATIPGEG